MIIGGRVENVTVNGSISSNARCVGGVAGCIKSGTLYNCVNNATIAGDSGDEHGGITGSCESSTILSCRNTGSIRGKSGVGGIVGATTTNSNITSCTNTKTITACGTLYQNFYTSTNLGLCGVGGIVGFINVSSTITSCSNTGPIATSSVLGGTFVCMGGIAGLVDSTSTITKSNNKGTITYKGKNGLIGGIAGYSLQSTINQCYNTNKIEGNSTSGGIVGWYDGGTVKNCYNTASVQGTDVAGGIAGGADDNRTKKKSYIYNCYSTNTSISGSDRVGTFMGSLTNMEIKNCIFIINTKYTGIEYDDLTWTSWKFLTVAEMQSTSSGILTMLNSNEGTENGQKLWAQDSKNSGFPYLRYNNP